MRTLLTILLRTEAAVAAFAYALVTALLLGEIVAREIFFTSIWGSQKMAVFAAIFAGFLGLTLATANNGHLRPQFADAWWPEAWRPAIARIGDVVSAIIFAGAGVFAIIYISDTFANGDRAAVLYWSLWPLQLVIAYAFFSCCLRHLVFAWRPALKPNSQGLEV